MLLINALLFVPSTSLPSDAIEKEQPRMPRKAASLRPRSLSLKIENAGAVWQAVRRTL